MICDAWSAPARQVVVAIDIAGRAEHVDVVTTPARSAGSVEAQ